MASQKDILDSWFADRLIAPLWRYYAQETGRPIRTKTNDIPNIGKACLLTCLGELRHYREWSRIIHPEFKKLLLVNSLAPYLKIRDRRELYKEIIESELLDIIPERLVHTCIVGFLGKWHYNYGGLRWYMIVRSIRDLFRSPNKKKLETLLYRAHNYKYFLNKVDTVFSHISHYDYRLCYIILIAGREWPGFFRKYNIDDVIKFNFILEDIKYLYSIPFREVNSIKVAKEDEKYYWEYHTGKEWEKEERK